MYDFSHTHITLINCVMPAQVLLDQIKLVGPNQLHNELVSLSFSAHQILGIVPSRGEGHRLTSSL